MSKLSKTIMLSTVTAFLALGQLNASLTISELEGMILAKAKVVKGHHGISVAEHSAVKSEIRPFTHLDARLSITPRVMTFEVQGRTYDSYTWADKDSLRDGNKTLVVTDAPALSPAGVASLVKFLATESDQEVSAVKKAQIR